MRKYNENDYPVITSNYYLLDMLGVIAITIAPFVVMYFIN